MCLRVGMRRQHWIAWNRTLCCERVSLIMGHRGSTEIAWHRVSLLAGGSREIDKAMLQGTALTW